jgi:hypothetical protein
MSSIAVYARQWQHVLTTETEAAARGSGGVQRPRCFSGSALVQTLVFGWVRNPAASLSELSRMAASRGVRITPQGLAQRFTATLAMCLMQVLGRVVEAVVVREPTVSPLLRRFTGVYVLDSSTLSLPAALAELWPGCGGQAGQGQAALKLQVRLELTSGSLAGPLLEAGRASDRATALQHAPLPAGSLRLADVGYFSGAVACRDGSVRPGWPSLVEHRRRTGAAG